MRESWTQKLNIMGNIRRNMKSYHRHFFFEFAQAFCRFFFFQILLRSSYSTLKLTEIQKSKILNIIKKNLFISRFVEAHLVYIIKSVTLAANKYVHKERSQLMIHKKKQLKKLCNNDSVSNEDEDEVESAKQQNAES